jgi:CMP-N,N'-diacetyllegionaminic acid synthase
MYKDKYILATVCARAGSQGVKNKNIRNLNNQPMIKYSLDLIKNCKYIDDYIISTDGDEIITKVRELGFRVDFKRPDYLSSNEVARVDAVKHAADWYENNKNQKIDVVIDLGVATPFKNMYDLEKVIELLIDKEYENVITATESHRNPYFNMVEIQNENVVKSKDYGIYTNRQSTPKVYDMNDAFNAYRRETLLKKEPQFTDNTGLYVMPKIRSIDIDEELDFTYAEFLIKNGYLKNES